MGQEGSHPALLLLWSSHRYAQVNPCLQFRKTAAGCQSFLNRRLHAFRAAAPFGDGLQPAVPVFADEGVYFPMLLFTQIFIIQQPPHQRQLFIVVIGPLPLLTEQSADVWVLSESPQ